VDSNADAARFDYSQFGWCNGIGTGGNSDALTSETDAMNQLLMAWLPTGQITGDAFIASGPSVLVTFENWAQPTGCRSCKTREQQDCPTGTVLVGCAFKWAGHCATCFVDDANPCGNCQGGRLRAMLPSGEIWEPGDEWEWTGGGAQLTQRVQQACNAMPRDQCAWQGEAFTSATAEALDFTPSKPRHSGNPPVTARAGHVASTYLGRTLPPACCGTNDACVGDGHTARHVCAFAMETAGMVPAKSGNGAYRNVDVAWEVFRRASFDMVTASVVTPSGLSGDLVYTARFYASDEGSGTWTDATWAPAGTGLTITTLAHGCRSFHIGPYATVHMLRSGSERVVVHNDTNRRKFVTLWQTAWGTAPLLRIILMPRWHEEALGTALTTTVASDTSLLATGFSALDRWDAGRPQVWGAANTRVHARGAPHMLTSCFSKDYPCGVSANGPITDTLECARIECGLRGGQLGTQGVWGRSGWRPADTSKEGVCAGSWRNTASYSCTYVGPRSSTWQG